MLSEAALPPCPLTGRTYTSRAATCGPYYRLIIAVTIAAVCFFNVSCLTLFRLIHCPLCAALAFCFHPSRDVKFMNKFSNVAAGAACTAQVSICELGASESILLLKIIDMAWSAAKCVP